MTTKFLSLLIALAPLICLSTFAQEQSGPEVGKITDQEKDQVLRRTEALSLKYIGFGPAQFSWGDGGVAFGFGYNYEVDLDWAIRLQGILGLDTDGDLSQMVAGSIGLQYFFSRKKFAPYAFGNFGYGIAFGGDIESFANDFSFGLGAGMLLFRTANTQMDIQLGVQQLIGKAERAGTMAGQNFRPQTLSLMVGVLY